MLCKVIDADSSGILSDIAAGIIEHVQPLIQSSVWKTKRQAGLAIAKLAQTANCKE
jgi:hypothetical protein